MKRVAKKTALVASIFEVLVMTVIFILVNRSLTDTLEERVMHDATVIATDRAALTESFVRSCCLFLDGYSRSTEVREALKAPEDTELVQALQEYTLRYAKGHDNLEGLYTAKWDTFVLAHVNPASVGKTFRDADGAKTLEDQIRKERKAFCSGIVKAPVTEAMVIPLSAPVYDETGAVIGFVGAAFYREGLQQSLAEAAKQMGIVDCSVLNLDGNLWIFDNDPDMIGTECRDTVLLSAIEELKESGEGGKVLIGEEKVYSLYYLEERDWVFIVTDADEQMFSMVRRVRISLIGLLLAVAAVSIFLLILFLNFMLRPFKAIDHQIERLRDSDYSEGHAIEKYKDREDEFGKIANAVIDLRQTMEKQRGLFLEILEVQTVGTVVMQGLMPRIVLINDMALQMYGLSPKDKEDLTVEDIRACFTKEELEHIDEQLKGLSELDNSGKILKYECSLIHRNGREVHLLNQVKTVTLCGNELFTIFSILDISDQIKLEEKLQTQSESDYLTGLCSRRAGEVNIEKALDQDRRGMFLLFDINRFRRINENFGHSVGDEVLIGVANAMRRTFRASDVLIRLGGDEFVV
ncbi:MAG: diguanylate cyclase, partial [Lachnospiraceae bacterium]|nr:diguanylate cyclase [Lachnospiraceae bacterium]